MSPPHLFAGMPTVVLTDVAKLRIEVISFFLVVFLLCAVVVRWVWNGLARDFPRLPRLGIGRALGLVAVWAALFVLVLTMISGARELMTPGAWKRDGATYKLNEENPPAVAPSEASESLRREKLDALRIALWERVGADKVLPESRDSANVSGDAWVVPHPSGLRYLYIPGRSLGADPPALVAAEPDLFSASRLGLFTDGSIRPVAATEVESALAGKGE